MLPVLETGLFDNSDNDECFYGFRAEDIVLWEAVADSNFDANEVSSVHTSDWSNESNGDWDEDITIGTGGDGEHGRSMIDSP